MFFPYFMILCSFRKDLIVCLSLFSQFSYSPHLLFSRFATLPLLPCFQSSTYLSLALLYLVMQLV